MYQNQIKKILITGGSGFIGTHLCEALILEKHEVRVLDLKSPTRKIEGVEYVKGDIRDQALLHKMAEGVDAVYHLAAMVSVPLCQEQPIESYQTNLMGTCGVLDAIRKENRKRGDSIKLFFAGSSVVYGTLGQPGIPLQEETYAPWPLSLYGAQKLGSEHAIRQYHQAYGLSALIFRFFNVYGPGQDPKSPYSGVISIFSNNLQEGKPLYLHGGGVQTRDFVFVRDLVKALVKGLGLPHHQCNGQPVNLGSGIKITVKELADTMVEVARKNGKLKGGEFKIQSSAPRDGDVPHSLADISKAQEVLNWKPQTALSDGLREVAFQ